MLPQSPLHECSVPSRRVSNPQGTAKMEDHETRRKIIRQWRSLPKDKRQTAEQAAAFVRKAVEENELQPSRRDPYQRMIGWLLPRMSELICRKGSSRAIAGSTATRRPTRLRARRQARLRTFFAICGKREGKMVRETRPFRRRRQLTATALASIDIGPPAETTMRTYCEVAFAENRNLQGPCDDVSASSSAQASFTSSPDLLPPR